MPRFIPLLIALLILPAVGYGQLQLHIDSLDVGAYPEIRMVVRVMDGNSNMRDLQIEDFTVFEDGFVQPITAGYCEDTVQRQPLSLLLLMDISRSMGPWPYGNNAIVEAKRSAKAFVDLLSDDDEIALVSFSDETYYNQTWTNNRPLVKQKIDQLSVRAGTALWDAVLTSANLILAREKKKVMIVLADGQDGSSNNPASLAINYAINAGCVVYTIGLGDEVDVANMTTLATSTGGKYFQAPTTADLDRIYQEIIQQLETTGVCHINYLSPIDCWNGDEVTIEVAVKTTRGTARNTVTYNLPYDTTTFSYVNLAMDREFVVEAGKEITVPVELTRVSALRAPSRFDFSVNFDVSLLQIVDVRVGELTPLFTITSTPTLRGSDVTIVGGSAITTPGQLCEITFRAAQTFESRKSEISVSPPDVQQFCTVASSTDGLVTVSGYCERALQQGASTITKTRLLSVSPNPFATNASVSYHVGREEHLRLSVFDMMGREAAVLVDAPRSTGDHTVSFNATNLPSGQYVVKLVSASVTDGVQIILTK